MALAGQLEAKRLETTHSRLRRWIDVATAFVGIAILVLTIAASMPSRADFGERLTRNTVRISFACYLLALFDMMRLADDDWLAGSLSGRLVRWCWSFACVYFIAHVISAFQFYHHWSHRDAFERTRAASGFGEGLYASYAFTIAWTADAAWWWLVPRRYARRSKWIGRVLHAFLAFIVFNATVVFASGPIRVAGAVGFSALLAALLVRWTRRVGRSRRWPT